MSTFTNTRTLLGDAGALDALVSHSLETFADDTITEIGKYGFYHHDELKTIYLPNVRRVGLGAFNNCTNLQKVYLGFNQNAVAYLYNNNCFENTGHCVILVPDDLVSAYRTTIPWSTHADYIYGANDPDAPFWDETEIEDDVETIASYVNAGTAASRYNLGQYKTIDLGSEGQIRMQIVGKNMRELANSTQRAQLEWMAMDLLETPHQYNPQYQEGVEGTGTIGGYDKSELKTYIDTDIWAFIPTIWQNLIKETKIITSTSADNMTTTAKLRIPSAWELTGKNASYENSGISYYFATRNDGNLRVRKLSSNNVAYTYWLRSSNGSSTTTALYVTTSGGIGARDTNVLLNRICLAFST